MSKLKLLFTRLLIYVVVLTVLLPASFFASIIIAPQAHAESKMIETKTKLKEPASKIAPEVKGNSKVIVQKSIVKPMLISEKGLKEVYASGEKIMVALVFSGKVTSAWAVTDSLDPSFPSEISLKNIGDGTWKLETPVLTRNLNTGVRMFYVYAKADNDTIIQAFQVKLQKSEIVPVKITNKVSDDGHLFLAWTNFKQAYNYIVVIKRVKDGKELRIETKKSQIAATLDPGTLYSFDLFVLDVKNREIVGSLTGNLKTLGTSQDIQVAQSHVQQVAVQPKKEIGQGVSTVSEDIKGTKDQTIQEPTPEPSSSPQGEASENEGWSRLLVALAILVIAAGAAIGGYYGYEWYASAHEDKSEPKSGSRW